MTSHDTGVISWLGLRLQPLSLRSATNSIFNCESARAYHLCNAWTVVLAQSDAALMESLRSPRALNLVDGTSLRIAMLLEGKRGVPVSRGPSLFRLALEEGAAHGKKQILLGGSSDFDSQMRATLSERNVPTHNLRVIDPGYQRITPAWLEAILTTVRQYGDSDVIWVGLGTPKQDIVADYITKHLGVTTVAVGAAFDFYAGSVREAPQWLHHSGFEWVYRLLKEPRRLWRRYALGNLAFARLILRSHLRARLVRRKP